MVSKLARLWDQDGLMVHAFAEGESHTVLPLEHPAARMMVAAADARKPLFVTVDSAGDRMFGVMREYEVSKVAGARVMSVLWAELD
ncbi:hypothetical protein [Nocardia wallacei]|uniref:hypothetical protein n=1 Tax=Nocardia wallacei TaxID=480035 RepID=UPI002456A49B|nr:hypothetical protein [Nocardia wallacei]